MAELERTTTWRHRYVAAALSRTACAMWRLGSKLARQTRVGRICEPGSKRFGTASVTLEYRLGLKLADENDCVTRRSY